MARKNKNLASFDDLADINININNNINNNINEDDNNIVNNYVGNDTKSIDINDSKQDDYLDQLIKGNISKKKNETVLTGIYLQKDIAQILNKLGKKGGKGAKSKIVNEALRELFKKKGLL